MSNALAIAAVTETFSRIVEAAARTAVPSASISNGRPAAPPATNPTRVSVYLYRVSENPHMRGGDLPTRNSGGTVLTEPQIALTLEYLVSFFGVPEELECERMVGEVVSTLHARPLLSPGAIQSAIVDQVSADPTHFLADADLPQQVEGVRVTPSDLSLEEMSKLWSVFFQEPYTVSVAYTASVVLISRDEPTEAQMPVRTHQVRAAPVGAPLITSVIPAAVPASPPAAAVLTLRGSGLASEHVVVTFGGIPAAPRAVMFDRVVVPVPGTLPSGVHVLHVTHMVDWGTSSVPDPRPLIESNRVAFALQPVIAGFPATVARPGPLTLRIVPELRMGQQIRLVLREVTASTANPPRSFDVQQAVEDPGSEASFDLTGAPAGEFWLRVAVDEVTSPLDSDDTGFTGPTVVLT